MKQTEDSDVDILVEFSEVPTLFELVEIEDLLSEKIGASVDLVHKSGLLSAVRNNILSETVYL